MQKSDIAARIVGMIVFISGIALLVIVFGIAFKFFSAESNAMQASVNNTTAAPVTAKLGQSALSLIIRIGLLIVMALVGSLLASRGIQFYFAGSNTRINTAEDK